MRMIRREFLKLASTLPLAMPAMAQAGPTSMREFLARLTYKRQEVNLFLDPAQPNWARFDSELGYLLRDGVLRDGVDNARTILSFGKAGERKLVNYADRPCRLNTYGNSFTQGHQVSDGETWQEYLAAHFGEPIRNFGIGGFCVYQAVLRMMREEAASAAAGNLILNIWGLDDHFRSIDAWRWLRFGEGWRNRPEYLRMFHGNPWSHARLDLKTGKLLELPNPFPTRESLYQLTDKEFVYEHFHNDPIAKLILAQRPGAVVSKDELASMAAALDVSANFDSPASYAETARATHVEYALRVGMLTTEKAWNFAQTNNKKLLVLLSYDSNTVKRACDALPRPDPALVAFLRKKQIPFVDLLEKHVEDFQSFNLSSADYVRRYFIGHYKPQGNHFFAFAIKDAVAAQLNPKPLAYREGSETIKP